MAKSRDDSYAVRRACHLMTMMTTTTTRAQAVGSCNQPVATAERKCCLEAVEVRYEILRSTTIETLANHHIELVPDMRRSEAYQASRVQ